MAKPNGTPAARVQVYLENPRIEKALRREAAVSRLSLSRAAEQAIGRGLAKRPVADPDDRMLNLERRLHDHMRRAQRDSTIVMELVVELARALFLRLPDSLADDDRLLQAAAGLRIERLLDAVAMRIAAGGMARASSRVDGVVESLAGAPSAGEVRTFTAAER